jgi:hypothetical protein
MKTPASLSGSHNAISRIHFVQPDQKSQLTPSYIDTTCSPFLKFQLMSVCNIKEKETFHNIWLNFLTMCLGFFFSGGAALLQLHTFISDFQLFRPAHH